MSTVDKYLQEVEERAGKATPGPFIIKPMLGPHEQPPIHFRLTPPDGIGSVIDMMLKNDAEFYQEARTDVDRLARMVRSLFTYVKSCPCDDSPSMGDACVKCALLRDMEEISGE